jgi:serine phosphatase RsbU (regulator of sigma subunit)
VTAAVVRLDGGIARVATAGHPVPLLLGPDGPVFMAVDPAPPLALDAPGRAPIAEATWPVPPGAVLMLHTDGLTDRRTADGVRMLDPAALCAGLDTTSLDAAADALLAAADAVAPANDDVSLLLVRTARS